MEAVALILPGDRLWRAPSGKGGAGSACDRGHCSAKPGVFHSVPEGTLVLQECTYICDSLRKANEKSGLESLGEVNAGHNRACKVELGERDSRTGRFLREGVGRGHPGTTAGDFGIRGGAGSIARIYQHRHDRGKE